MFLEFLEALVSVNVKKMTAATAKAGITESGH